MSQNFVLSLSFIFMLKNGKLFNYLIDYFFLHSVKKKKELGPN